jgi:hypothetical protein
MTGLLRDRGMLLTGCGLLLAIVLSAWLSSGRQAHSARLDPQNPGPDGAQALAQVLGDHGVDLDIVRSAAELERTDLSGASVVITSTDNLGRSTARRLAGTVTTTPVLIIDAGPEVVGLLSRSGTPSMFAPQGPLSAQCADTRLTGLEVEADLVVSYPAVDAGCFPDAQGGVLFAPQDEALSLFGAGAALSNSQITRADNAAVALRLLGNSDRLVWYVPSLADLAAGDEVGVKALLPSWFVPALWLAGLGVLALMLWRGRRFGPLASEPLPVVVRAIETTQSRGRLYRKARDRDHAAATLRGAAQARAAHRLGLGRNSVERQVLEQVARHTGLTLDEVGPLMSLLGPVPDSDTALNTLAEELAAIDDQLRKAPR